MAWISILLMILQYGPAIFQIVSEIIDLIRKLRGKPEQAQFTNELVAAVETYKKSKDRRPLRALREKLYAHCDTCKL